MTAPQTAVAAQQVAQYGAATATMQTRLLTFLLGMWDTLGQYRDAQATSFVDNAVPIVNGAQQAMATLTASYLSQVNELAGHSATPGPVLSGEQLAGIRGVAPAEVYRRPFVQMYTALSNGRPFADSVASGRSRLQDIAASDLQLAKTHQAIETLGRNDNVVGYRRVLVGERSCALCVLASTQRYHKAELMPIHPNCDCAVAPIYGNSDPGRVINSQVMANPDALPEDAGDLASAVHQVMQNATGTSDASGRAVDYRKYLITHTHGELGPVISLRGQEFTGPNDLKEAA